MTSFAFTGFHDPLFDVSFGSLNMLPCSVFKITFKTTSHNEFFFSNIGIFYQNFFGVIHTSETNALLWFLMAAQRSHDITVYIFKTLKPHCSTPIVLLVCFVSITTLNRVIVFIFEQIYNKFITNFTSHAFFALHKYIC